MISLTDILLSTVSVISLTYTIINCLSDLTHFYFIVNCRWSHSLIFDIWLYTVSMISLTDI